MFGMGTGGALQLLSPETVFGCECPRVACGWLLLLARLALASTYCCLLCARCFAFNVVICFALVALLSA